VVPSQKQQTGRNESDAIGSQVLVPLHCFLGIVGTALRIFGGVERILVGQQECPGRAIGIDIAFTVVVAFAPPNRQATTKLRSGVHEFRHHRQGGRGVLLVQDVAGQSNEALEKFLPGGTARRKQAVPSGNRRVLDRHGQKGRIRYQVGHGRWF